MDRVRVRIGDKRVLGLVKAFLHSGILSEDGRVRGAKTGTPQGSLWSAEHKEPNEQSWVMRSADV
jgi:RNA-directed DNA polymerase